MAASRTDDLNLSLTGSQISTISARSKGSRPNSAQGRRPKSSAETKSNKFSGDDQTKATPKRQSSLKQTPHSGRSVDSYSHSDRKANKNRVNGAHGNQEEDFLALFESSVQPKIKRPSAINNSNVQSKKPSSNAVKVLWTKPAQKPKPAKPAWASKPAEDDSARSDEPHNIFQPLSGRSSSPDVDNEEKMEELDNSLSQSINKLHNLQKQLSGVNKHSAAENGDLTLNSYRSVSSASAKTLTPQHSTARSPRSLQAASLDDFIQDVLVQTSRDSSAPGTLPVNTNSANVHSESNLQSESRKPNDKSSSPLANNVSHLGQQPKAKTSLSSMENSYQNIKHKTPVNQVKSSHRPFPVVGSDMSRDKPNLSNRASPSRSDVNSKTDSQGSQMPRKSTGQSLVEDYITTLNDAAKKIQIWYRRHRVRQKAGAAAIKRLLHKKHEDHQTQMQLETAQSMTAAEMEERKQEERKKAREEKAREARQQAIKELQKKREGRKNEVKKVAEEEISFLQASGKITKSPSVNSLSNKKKTMKAGMQFPHTATSPRPASTVDNADSTGQGSGPQDVVTDGPPASKSLGAIGGTDIVTESQAHTTLDELYSTLKRLEEEENFLSARSEKKASSWLDELEKLQEGELGSNLTAENLEKLNSRKDGLSKSGFLTDDKLKTIINFLDEVQVTDRLSEIDTEISRMNEDLEKPVLLVPSAEEVVQIEKAQATASEVTNTVLSQRLELDERTRTVSMLQKALNQQRELTVRHARETEKEMKKRLDVQKDEYEEAIKRHLSFIDQLIDDKKTLGEKCEKLVTELKVIDKRYQDKFKSNEETHAIEMTKLKEIHSAAEKLRREKWIEDKTKRIKEMTVKGLEPEIQRLIAKHKSDVKKINQIHEAELLEADERAAQKYVKMTEELRDQLATEKEAACSREREMSKQRYEKQLQQEEEAYQQQRRRLYQEVQEEKDRVASSSSRQKMELEKLQRQLEDNHRLALEAMKEEFDTSRREQERRHKSEIQNLQEKLKIEKESWEENYMKRHETWLVQKERELRDQVKKERDKEIEMVIDRLEEDASTVREENERSTEVKIRRMREKFEAETRELEQSERKAVQKHNEIKAKMTEVEGENERLKVVVRQKEREILDGKKLIEKMNSERSHVSDIIRQEFADRIVATDEENKRTKHEISELRARHRLEIERLKNEMEELKVSKDEEMEEVHKRVKQAIVKKEEVVSQLRQQYQAANKRADHLEGLLEQQRKQLLKK